MTEEQIRAEFKAAGWDGLKSKPPVMNLMREAREFFSDEEYALMDRYPLVDATNQTKAWDLIGKALKELSSNPNVAAAYPGFTEAASRFTENLNEPRSMGWDVRPQSEAIEMSFWLRTFSDWCFPKSDSKAQHVYRPHEIFRYAARNGWKPSLLIRSRSALAKGFLPFPERATSSGWRFEDFPVFFEQRGDTAWNQEFGSSSGSEPADGGEAARSGSES